MNNDFNNLTKMIYVYFDDNEVIKDGKPVLFHCHNSVLKEMNKGTDIIYTHVPSFFDFNTLKEGYDVTVIRDNEEIILSEMLKGKYTDKEIRLEHNAYKMLMADVLHAS